MSYNYNFKKHKRGDTFKGTQFTITRQGSPVNLTDASIRMDLRKLAPTGELGATYEVGTGFTVTDAVNGVFQFDEQIIAIAPALYYHDIEIILNTGEKKTWIEGTWEITQDVSDPDATS